MPASDASDMDLVREYVRANSEQAFRILVERHINMVHAVALRQTDQPQFAEDVTQAVFIVLAEKAASLPQETLLAGWLFRATRFAAANVRRAEARRKHWEQKAAQMEPNPDSDAEQITPLLNQALEALPEQDRAAILLRFFENKSMDEVGHSLGTSTNAAKMRLSRAVEKLRLIFRRKGVAVSTTALMGVLSAQAAHAAPAGLASSVATLAFLKQTSASTLPIVKGTLILMAQTKSKTLLIAALVLLLGGATALIIQQSGKSTSPASPGAEKAAAKETQGGTKPASTTPATNAAAKVLVFRNVPSWNRNPDFEDAMASMRIDHEVKPATEMSRADLSAYRVIVIPGAQWNTDFYQEYAANADRFDSYVTNGGTLVLELNGAENDGIPLPRGVTMIKHGARENSILVRDHPILTPMSGRNIRANFASHGWLEGVPQDALVLAAETNEGEADLGKPTFVEYAHGAGRVIAACQCFHDRDGSGRGVLMETVLDYATGRRWFARKE